ncbi:hsp20/alpha crystallin family protein [Asticcacaulis biprosthecium C19]|uniref:Hsp20/alpha crystallin family protein n=1 Tax=Asticcacaulis biprosthecium C19 TaxID=715226 RepID=F4QJJ2_9CAUL|nr:Hsp20 family protein [Asticcacaulis biprosthecium]EGF91943.1 hsp20/alpha crystallin family protein [Asticcacaulis biprosthecium C19]
MTRTIVFDSPYLLGFDDMRALIERVGRGHDNYPPYNVEALGPAEIRISIAVAGFTADQLAVEVKGAHLMVMASKDRGDETQREFLHRGIGLRNFNRAFVMGEGWEVAKATLAYGLLHIDLIRPPASEDVRRIPIQVA